MNIAKASEHNANPQLIKNPDPTPIVPPSGPGEPTGGTGTPIAGFYNANYNAGQGNSLSGVSTLSSEFPGPSGSEPGDGIDWTATSSGSEGLNLVRVGNNNSALSVRIDRTPGQFATDGDLATGINFKESPAFISALNQSGAGQRLTNDISNFLDNNVPYQFTASALNNSAYLTDYTHQMLDSIAQIIQNDFLGGGSANFSHTALREDAGSIPFNNIPGSAHQAIFGTSSGGHLAVSFLDPK